VTVGAEVDGVKVVTVGAEARGANATVVPVGAAVAGAEVVPVGVTGNDGDGFRLFLIGSKLGPDGIARDGVGGDGDGTTRPNCWLFRSTSHAPGVGVEVARAKVVTVGAEVDGVKVVTVGAEARGANATVVPVGAAVAGAEVVPVGVTGSDGDGFRLRQIKVPGVVDRAGCKLAPDGDDVDEDRHSVLPVQPH
jgi:hypothetical protein